MSDESAIAALTALLVQHNEQHAGDMREIRDRLAVGDTRMAGLEHSIAEVKRIAEETRTEARRTNGRVTELEAWKSARIAALADAAAEERGAAKQRREYWSRVDFIRGFIDDFWPLILGAVLGGIGAGSFLWRVLR